MKTKESLIEGLLKGHEEKEFEDKVAQEKSILANHSHGALLNITALMSVYINTVMPLLLKEMPIAEQAYKNGIRAAIKARSNDGRKGAITKKERDPKQQEKNFVFDCWRKWQFQPENYKSKAEFARDMLDKCELLQSQKVIEDWCRSWSKIPSLLAD